MNVGTVLRRVVTMCQGESNSTNETDSSTHSSEPPLKIDTLRAVHHQTFPLENTRRRPHPSQYQTAPAATVDAASTTPASAPTSSATESPTRRFRRTPTVELEENPAYHPTGGPEYLHILAKYNLFGSDEHHGRIVSRFVNAGNIRERHPQVIHVEEFSAQGNQEFLAHIKIGNPPQTLRVDLDTGSSDFWVFSTLLKSPDREKAAAKHTIFDPNSSKTWRWPHRAWGGPSQPFSWRRKDLKWDILYGDMSAASGNVGWDEVQIGDIKIGHQAVQLAKSFTGNQFLEGSADGILGLAFGHLNSVQPGPVKTPLEMMTDLGLLPEHLFTVNLSTDCFFTFGFIDETTRAGRDIKWVDVDSRGGFWDFSSRHARVGNKRLKRSGGRAIADTGSSIILTHPHIVWMIYKQVDGAMYDSSQPGWVYPADAKVPEVAFSVGDDESFMVEINEKNMHHSDLGNGFVFGAIQENPAYENGGLQFDIFGTPFFRHVYAIFDIKGERFGVIKEGEDVDEGETIVARTLVESPVMMERVTEEPEEQDEEIEDSVDGSIRETYPRRSSTIRSMIPSPIEEDQFESLPDVSELPEISGKQGEDTGITTS